MVGSEQASCPKKTNADQREEQRSSGDESDQEDIEINDSADIAPPDGERKETENVIDQSSAMAGVTVHQAATQTLDFLTPFLEELHSEHTKV